MRIVPFLAAPVAYAGLVLVMWIPFGPRNGMPYETSFAYASEHSSWFDGFFYRGDALRPYTSLTYHLGYLIGEVFGLPGSFVPYQVVYATLWWGRGVLVFAIVGAVFGRRSIVAYLAGALTIAHASDNALNWVGQMNQFGMMFFLLASLWLLLQALMTPRIGLAAFLTFGSTLLVYMALWSYESGLFIALLVPAAFVLLRRSFRSWERLGFLGVYYIVPAYYIALNVRRYATGGQTTYQESVTRDDLGLASLASDLVFNVKTSIEFWKWSLQMPPANAEALLLVGILAGLVTALGALFVCGQSGAAELVGTRRELVVAAALGGAVLVASFPAYLVLTSARLVWRTQFLSGVGFGLLAAATIGLGASFIPRQAFRLVVCVAVGAVIAAFGARAAYKDANFHYGIWERHKHAVAEVLSVAPQVEQSTVIVYTGVPAEADPFGHTMWFDLAMRLAYPTTAVTGEYYLAGGKPAPGATLALEHGVWRPTDKGFTPLVKDVPLDHTLFIRYGTDAVLAHHVPAFLAASSTGGTYDPYRVVIGTRVDARAERRYGPVFEGSP
jgi:hypothetical protein